MDSLDGRTVLITGASRGLGAALALAFGRAGARVSLCARSAETLRQTAEAVRSSGAEAFEHVADVTDEAQVREWVEETAQRFGAPAVLVNNASVLGPRAPLREFPLEEWRRTLEINLNGVFITTRAVLPPMLEAGSGAIINISSGAAVLPRARWGAYSVSKYAMEGLSQNLAHELEGTGVRVNVVDPGAMRTQMRATAYPEEDPNTLKTPAQTTEVFLWLASDASAEVSGQRFQADRFQAP